MRFLLLAFLPLLGGADVVVFLRLRSARSDHIVMLRELGLE